MDRNDDDSLSAVIEDFLRDYADIAEEQPDQNFFLEKSELSQKQKKIVRELIRSGKTEIGLQQLSAKIKRKGIYDRKDFVEKAIKRIDKDNTVPYELKGDSLSVLNLRCTCGSEFGATGLQGDGACPNCGTVLIDLDKSQNQNAIQVVS